ncbi:MAG: PstS family phosphate ABC transporter substrate-binding protein [Chroococcidiopsidaceae cyanobacterium CP_BM_RX_35]|nr:PstS family phosphate ABC transporter substrate-binding protein [Chroococcidiopsidaceae cyanobacterium CP_BM_RX_35]
MKTLVFTVLMTAATITAIGIWAYSSVRPIRPICPANQHLVGNTCVVDNPLPTSVRTPSDFKTVKVSFRDVPNVPTGTFNYGGSTTFAPLRSQAIVSSINQAHPGFHLRYTAPPVGNPGSGAGIKMLVEGQLSFAQSSRPVKNEEFNQAKARSFSLQQISVAIDGIAFYVNPQLNIRGLNLSQIKEIFTGKVTNWKAIGGPELPITPFSRSEVGGTVVFLKEAVLNNEPFGLGVQEVQDTTESIRKVAQTPGSIGYATATEVVGQKSVRALPLAKANSQSFVPPFTDANSTVVNDKAFIVGSYPLTRRLFVVIRRDGTIDELAGVAYVNLLLSNEGQQWVKKVGFVPIR